MNRSVPHPDPETLLRLVDEDLPPTEATEAGEHLAGCEYCREQVAMLREALEGYGRFHREVLKPSLAPPGEWGPLRFPKTSRRYFRPAPWLAAAAAIAALFVAVRLFERAPEVRAAELLRKASAAEAAAPVSQGRIRIRTRSRTLDREARLRAGRPSSGDADVAAIRELFQAAGYGWEDPLSVEAFARWRDSLPEKQDRVERSAGVYLVRTSTSDGPLADAALSLRATDLHAFACTLRFRSGGEIIYMTELPAEISVPQGLGGAPVLPPPSRAAPAAPATGATPGDEVRVMAALHGIGADLGEPIEVEREGAAIVVRISGLGERRRGEIRSALSGMAFVQLRFEVLRREDSRAPAAARQAAVSADRANPLIADLAARSGDHAAISDLSDALIDATDRTSQRAFALRALARRFPAAATSQLSRADADTLGGILRDHAGALVTAIHEIQRLAAPILANSPPPVIAGTAPDWQGMAEGLPAAVDRVDRTLNGATDASDARKARLAQLVADLDRQAAALQRAVGQ